VILAIDPGTTQSGWCVLDSNKGVVVSDVDTNADVLERIGWACDVGSGIDTLAIEMIAGMGMIVGKETFDTCRWIGRFQQAWRDPESVRLIFRRDVKLHLCGNPRAKDPNIRQALIDKLGPKGTKANPGPLYGVASHVWSALAIAVTAFETKGEVK
jgi:hypothetical protein